MVMYLNVTGAWGICNSLPGKRAASVAPTVMVAPADGFYATPGLGVDEVRIAYVLEEPKLRRAMRILTEALQAYPGLKRGR